MNPIQLTQKLIRINSENPPGNEKAIAEFIYSYLKKLKLKPRLIKTGKNRYNVIASIGTKGPGLMLNGHIDTVPADPKKWKHDPFQGKITKGKIYGRGASDMKSGVAAILTAVENILKTKPKFKKRLLLTFVADEETGGPYGTRYLIKKKEIFKNIKYGIVGECTGLKITTAQKGPMMLKIIFRGSSAHGSKPELGENAILKASRFIVELDKLSKKIKKLKDPLLGTGTINVGVIKGGTKINMIPDYCEIEIDRRFTTKENKKLILKEIKNILRKLKIKAEIKILGFHEPMKIKEDSKIVRIIKRFIKTETHGLAGYTEIERFYRGVGLECVSFGPGPLELAHVTDEFVKISDIKKAVKVYENVIKEICLRSKIRCTHKK